MEKYFWRVIRKYNYIDTLEVKHLNQLQIKLSKALKCRVLLSCGEGRDVKPFSEAEGQISKNNFESGSATSFSLEANNV